MTEKYRVVRKTKDGFETKEFQTVEDAIKEKEEFGGFIDYFDEKLCCWRQLKAKDK